MLVFGGLSLGFQYDVVALKVIKLTFKTFSSVFLRVWITGPRNRVGLGRNDYKDAPAGQVLKVGTFGTFGHRYLLSKFAAGFVT